MVRSFDRSNRRRSSRKHASTQSYDRMATTSTASSSNADSEDEAPKIRRSSRRNATAPVRYRSDDEDDDDDDDGSESDDEESKEVETRNSKRPRTQRQDASEEESNDDDDSSSSSSSDHHPIPTRRPPPTRRSTRKAVITDYCSENVESQRPSQPKQVRRPARSKTPANPTPVKSPAVSHSARRARRQQEEDDDLSSADDTDEDSSEEEEEEEELRIQRVLASRSETRRRWREICRDLNTSEVENGSRWFQNDDDDDKRGNDDTYEERFLVKWADVGYLHCSWELEHDLLSQVEQARTALTNFFRKSTNGVLIDADERGDGDYYHPDNVLVERVLSIEPPDGDYGDDPNFGIVTDRSHPEYEARTGRQFLIKWWGLNYAESTYEFERDLQLNQIEYQPHVAAFLKRRKKPTKGEMARAAADGEKQTRRLYKFLGDSVARDDRTEQQRADYVERLGGVTFPNGGQLRDYQAEGVSFLLANHVNRRGSVLADEMGLGKTLQTAAFVNLLSTTLNRRGPYLIVVPLSTIRHWQREFLAWTHLNVIVYHGSAKDREYIREFDFAFEQDRPDRVAHNARYLAKVHAGRTKPRYARTWMVEVVVTTPEIVSGEDFTELCAVDWEVLVVDEAHKLKNHEAKLHRSLADRERMRYRSTLLLTGTPIQNNVSELWAIMRFVDPGAFPSLGEFLSKYGEMRDKEGVDKLHEEIRPYILRRLKEDVEKSVPPKEETLIEVELTVVQKQFYRALYEKNLHFLHKNKKKALDGPSLNNLAVQLRKCCNHPFLLRGVEEEIRRKEDSNGDSMSDGDFLVKSSGKLVLLDKLLPRLRADGHRVLLFSQFKIMLDVLEDYLRARGMSFERIDGNIMGNKRQMAIDRYQGVGSGTAEPPFIMLLSTRAGGVGINLTAADTCIIYDSDWNPQNDLQAQARCHRIGQTKDVKVYRLLSRKTYEMQMFHMSSLKMGLDQAVLHGIEHDGAVVGGDGERTLTKEEIERLLRHGAYDMFAEERDGASERESNEFVGADIDEILRGRSKTIVHDAAKTGGGKGGTFSKAAFKATPRKEGASAPAEDVDVDDPEFWTKMVGDKFLKEDTSTPVERKRRRRVTNYAEHLDDGGMETQLTGDGGSDAVATEDSFSLSENDGDDDDELDADFGRETAVKRRRVEILERYRWGYTKKRGKRRKENLAISPPTDRTEWSHHDVACLLDDLIRHGYDDPQQRSLPFRDPPNKTIGQYSHKEIVRMRWTCVLSFLVEALETDVDESIKKAERKKLLAAVNEDANNDAVPAIESSPPTTMPQAKDPPLVRNVELEARLKQVMREQGSVLSLVLRDLDAFAKTHSPRDEASLGMIFRSQEDVAVDAALTNAFRENIWSALMTRGWKEERVAGNPPETQDIIIFSYKGHFYSYIHDVLKASVTHHPELHHVVERVRDSVPARKTESQDVLRPINGGHTITVHNITFPSLKKYLLQYGCLQLLFERDRITQPKPSRSKISFPKRFVSSLNFLALAHRLVSLAEAPNGDTKEAAALSGHDALIRLLAVHRKSPLPHPQWTGRHDAILVRAIAKHGWIDRSSHYMAIVEDESLDWREPFRVDAKKKKPSDTKDSPAEKEDPQVLKAVATRAAAFLNDFGSHVDELRGLNKKMIVENYCLRQDAPNDDDDSGRIRWTLDESNPIEDNVARTAEEEEEVVVAVPIPGRNELVRRARFVLMEANNNLDRGNDPSKESAMEAGTVGKDQHGIPMLNQSSRRNFFFAELLRALLKLQNIKGALWKKILNVTLNEAEHLLAASSKNNESSPSPKSPESSDLETIVSHINILVNNHSNDGSRAVKNVLRVMLGLEPTRGSGGTLFPSLKPTPFQMVRSASTTSNDRSSPNRGARNSATRRLARIRDASTADVAIGSGLEIFLQRNRKKTPVQLAKMPAISLYLQLTSVDVLLLSVIVSQGLPVWNDNWHSLIMHRSIEVDADLKGKEYIISWTGMGEVFERAASEWRRSAFEELNKVKTKIKESVNMPQFMEGLNSKYEVLRHDASTKDEAYKQALKFSKNPKLLAKKVIMLMEAVRLHMGPVESFKGAKSRSGSSDNGLGTRLLNWMKHELVRWARSLEILNPDTHLPRPYPLESSKDTRCITTVALLDKGSCRVVISQIAQLCRLRSIFVRNGDDGMKDMLRKAVKTIKNNGDAWERRPHWWNENGGNEKNTTDHVLRYDHDLLTVILNYGFSGFEEGIENSSFRARLQAEQSTPFSMQPHINQLTRELSVLEDTAENVRLLNLRAANRATKGTSSGSGGMGSIQTGMLAFMSPKPEKKTVEIDRAAGKETDENHPNTVAPTCVIDLCDE